MTNRLEQHGPRQSSDRVTGIFNIGAKANGNRDPSDPALGWFHHNKRVVRQFSQLTYHAEWIVEVMKSVMHCNYRESTTPKWRHGRVPDDTKEAIPMTARTLARSTHSAD